MYDLISNIINHQYVSNYGGEQQYIYYICCAMIPLLTVVFVDFVKDIFSGFFRG